jgi:hypothetical protein
MYIIVYREGPHSSIKCWSKIYEDRDKAEQKRVEIINELGASHAWKIFIDDPR